MLGADTIVYASLESGERVVASIRGIHPIRDGSLIAYSVDRRFVHVFDQSGRALDPLRSWRDDYLVGAPPVEQPRPEAIPTSETRKTMRLNPISA